MHAFHDAAPLARNSGYILTWYGSTTWGVGRDLDLIAVPKVRSAQYEGLIQSFHRFLNWQQEGTFYRGAMGTLAATLRTQQGRIVDLQIREIPFEVLSIYDDMVRHSGEPL